MHRRPGNLPAHGVDATARRRHGVKLMTLDEFTPLLTTRFNMRLDDGTRLELTLSHIEALPHAGPGGSTQQRKPFSLIFHGPVTPVCQQRIYTLDNETLGEISIFLVPIGPDQRGQRYEA